MMNKCSFGLLPVLLLVALVGCKKDPGKISPPPRPGEEGDRTAAEQVLDSVYSKYQQLSYWASSIEMVDPISDLTDNYTDPERLLAYLKSQTPEKNDFVYHPEYSGPLDRFSWLEDLSDASSSAARADRAEGYGFYLAAGGGRTDSIYVYFVEGGSPAAEAGMRRGQRVVEMQGDRDMVGANVPNVERYVLQDQLNMVVYDEAGGEKEFDMTYTSYEIDPLVRDTVYQRGGDRIGYLALSSFEELYSQDGATTPLYDNLEAIFDRFGSGPDRIDELILDFRYNVGGYVSTAVHFANKVINVAGDKKTMFSYDVNRRLAEQRDRGDKEFADEIFARNSQLDLRRVYFLVTDNTASASEIVIAALMPYMDVQIIADNRATYGKPVGFFREDISKDLGLWAASFKIVNADGFTDYWDGIPATKSGVFDNYYLDFGDPNENMTKSAIDHITKGVFSGRATTQKADVRSGISDPETSRKINARPIREMKKQK